MSTVRPAYPAAPQGMRGILCPYCGQVSLNPKRCDSCGGFFDPLSRQASQNGMGPWYIRDARGPWRPGCSFETLRELVRKGRVTRETVLRGPATRQFWNFAGRTPTVANLLGVCHNCGGDVSPEAYSCAACGAVFTPETDRQHLGLAPVHLLPGQASPEIIAASSGAPARAPRARAAAVVREEEGERRGLPGWVIGVAIALVLLAGAAVAVVVIWPKEVRQIWEDVTGTAPVAAPAAGQPMPSGRADQLDVPVGDGAATVSAVPPMVVPAPMGVRGDAGMKPVEGAAELRLIREALLAGGEFDERELLGKLEEVRSKRPELGPEIDALAQLVKQRAEQARLRKLP
jgi:hypothetical protein